jgi:hypothetical protein
MHEAASPSLSPNLERPHHREAASLAVSVGSALDTPSTSGGPGPESIPCAKGSLFQREWVSSSNTSLNHREQFLAADQSPATKTRGSKKRSAKAEGHKWAGYHPKSKSWYGDGISPDGRRWRKYGFETALEASAWAIGTRRPMDELSYAAATLPAAITRDVANAMSIRSKAGLTSYEEGLFAQLVRGDLRRNPLGLKMTFEEAANEWLVTKEATKPRTYRDAKDCVALARKKMGSKLVTQIGLKDIEGVLKCYTRYRRRNILSKINQVFLYCEKHQYIGSKPRDNPCYGVSRPKIKGALPNPISFKDAVRLMALAVQTEESLGCTALISCCLFGGLRSSEGGKLQFDVDDGINVSGGVIRLNEDVAKIRARTVYLDADTCIEPDLAPFITGNLQKILSELPPKKRGPLTPTRRKLDLFRAYARHCGIELFDNCLRAGFASKRPAGDLLAG